MTIYFNDQLNCQSALFIQFGKLHLRNLTLANNPYTQLEKLSNIESLKLVFSQHPPEDTFPLVWLDLVKFQQVDYLISLGLQKNGNFIFNFRNETVGIIQLNLSETPSLVELDSICDINLLKLDECVRYFHTHSRNFNTLHFSNSSVAKKSIWKEKVEDEIFFYNSIPSEIRKYFPNIQNISDSGNEYTIEFIESFDLAQLYLNDLIDEKSISKILSNLTHFFNLCPRRPSSPEIVRSKLASLLIEKCETRLNQLFRVKEKYLYFQFAVRDEHLTLRQLFERLRIELLQEISNCPLDYLIFSHGDLVFSNILIREDHSLIFVDPRGGRDLESLFIPLVYDFAKLSQCFLGKYHQILNHSSYDNPKAEILFGQWLELFSVSKRLISLAEASLFLSLLPLHIDEEDRLANFIDKSIHAFIR